MPYQARFSGHIDLIANLVIERLRGVKMPANIIKINGVSEFYVGDSKMPKLLKWLKRHGFPENKDAEILLKEKDCHMDETHQDRQGVVLSNV